MDRVTIVCFTASYGVALGLDLLQQFRPRPVVRLLALAFGMAGLLAQTIYLAVQKPPLVWQFGWMMVLAWVLALLYLYGTLSYNRLAWGVFVLPLILGLTVLGAIFGPPTDGEGGRVEGLLTVQDQPVLGFVHAGLLLLATVSVCVGFLASLMYLFQAQRLRAKKLPGQGLRLLSLERLETINRQAINLAFPLLTAGLLVGVVLMARIADTLAGWNDPRVLGAGVLWITFAILLYLRYGYHLRGRQVSLLTIVVFILLLCCLALSHPSGQGGGR